jgi:hypothetical protein
MTVRRLTPRIVALAAAFATALVLAGCGGSGPSSAPTLAGPAESDLPPIEVPTFDLGTFAVPSFALPSFTRDEELEALLPDEIGGQIVVKQSLSGAAIVNSGLGAATTIESMLDEVDASIDDVSVAIGVAGNSIIVFAYEIDGVSAGRVFDGFLAALPSGGAGGLTTVTVAGRSVTQVVAAGETTYVYPAGDVMFVVGGTLTPEQLEDAVSQLPAE